MIAEGMKRYSITLDPGLVGEIDKLARRAGMHRGPFIAQLLEDVIANRRLQHARDDADELRTLLLWRIRAAEQRIQRI